MKKILLVIAVVSISLAMFTSCEDNTPKVYTVTFNANGGSGTMIQQTFTEGQSKALTANGFTAASGKKFEKWNTKADGTGSDYSNEVSYIATCNTTLYAQWEYLDLEVGDNGQAGIIFYDVDADNDSTNDGKGPDNLSSETNTASGDMPANWRYLEAAEYDIKLTGSNVGLATSSSDQTRIPFAYYRAVVGDGSNMYVNGETTYSAYNCTGKAIGTGAANTEKLVEAMKEDGSQAFTSDSGTDTTENYAANVCSKLEVEKEGATYSDWFLPSMDELDLMHENLKVKGVGNFVDSYYWSSSECDCDTLYAWAQYFGYVFLNTDSYRYYADYVRAIRAF